MNATIRYALQLQNLLGLSDYTQVELEKLSYEEVNEIIDELIGRVMVSEQTHYS